MKYLIIIHYFTNISAAEITASTTLVILLLFYITFLIQIVMLVLKKKCKYFHECFQISGSHKQQNKLLLTDFCLSEMPLSVVRLRC